MKEIQDSTEIALDKAAMHMSESNQDDAGNGVLVPKIMVDAALGAINHALQQLDALAGKEGDVPFSHEESQALAEADEVVHLDDSADETPLSPTELEEDGPKEPQDEEMPEEKPGPIPLPAAKRKAKKATKDVVEGNAMAKRKPKAQPKGKTRKAPVKNKNNKKKTPPKAKAKSKGKKVSAKKDDVCFPMTKEALRKKLLSATWNKFHSVIDQTCQT